MTRLPQPGADTGFWGEILNEYLRKEHNDDGTHKIADMLDVPATEGKVLVSDPTSPAHMSWQTVAQVLPAGGASSQVIQKTGADDNDIAWATITKTDIGLGNVDNTADSDKPISTAQQAAFDQKADNTNVVKLAGAQTINDTKTFSSPLRVAGLHDVSGGVAVAITTTPSAVNHIKVTAAGAGTEPRIEADGETNVHMVLRAKGSGAVKLADGNGKTVVQTATSANAVNHVTIRNATSGFAPFISADGADSNVSLFIRGKGAAGVVLSDSVANKVVEVNGTSRLGFFGASTVVQQTGGVRTAGAGYSANEQTMINIMYAALRNYGLLT